MSLPTYDALYAFLKARYKHDRFEGRNTPEWSPGYSNDIANSYMIALGLVGKATIPQHESASGQVVRFDSSLQILETR